MLRKIAEYLGSNKTLCEGDTLTVYHKDQIIVDQMEIEKSFILETVDIYDVENELDIILFSSFAFSACQSAENMCLNPHTD